MNTQSTSKPRTLADIFFAVVNAGSPRVMMYEVAGHWRSISADSLYKRVVGTAKMLRSLGIGRGDRVAILSENRPEWMIADFATLLIGAASVPIYATQTAEQCSYLLKNSGARAVFVSSDLQLAKIASVRSDTNLETVIMMNEPRTNDPSIIRMSAAMSDGPDSRDAEFDARCGDVTRDDLATLIYTSGTTGIPKGAMLTHGNIASNLAVSLDAFPFETGEEIAISFLPLSHITARHVDFALLFRGVALAYCPNIEDLPRMLLDLKPTFFVAVPRVYEKIYNQALRTAGEAGIRRSIFDWAVATGAEHLTDTLAGKRPRSLKWKLADRLVFAKLRERMGGRIKYHISGGAPLGRELAEWYAKVGIRIHEGYGLTETSPVIAVNTPSAHRLGTVGKPLSNVDVHIADDGEILVRAPSVFQGYWNMPEETANVFKDGWFCTGDIGAIDRDGFLSVTDRKKDLLKTSGGKFIAPQPIENSLKANPLVAEAAVIGDKRRFAAVVIVPSFAALEEWAQNHGVVYSTRAALVADPRVQQQYRSIVDSVNATLAKFEKLKKVLVVAEELSIEDGTLTPTLKLRRRNVEARYRDRIEKLYEENSTADVAAS